MQPAPPIERDPRDVGARASRRQCDIAGDVPAIPIRAVRDRGWHRVRADRERVQAAVAVEDVATGPITQQHQPLRDIPIYPIAAASCHRCAPEGMNSAPAVQRVPLGV